MNKIPMRKYAYRVLIFSIIIAVLSVALQLLLPQYASPALPFIVLFFFVITLLTLYIVLRSNNYKESSRFFSSYFLSRIIKFFSCLTFLFLYIVLNKEDRWNFAVAFIIIYFFYSFLEVYILKKEQEREKKTDSKEQSPA